MKPKVSIVVPIYNVEKYLRRCVDSLRNQTLDEIEIILVDDGSPDNCPQICDEYANMDNRIKVIHKKNGGLSDARNFGIREANGEYLLMVDSDDWCENSMVEELYNTMVFDETDITICGYNIDYTNNNFSVYADLGEAKKFCGKVGIAEAIYKLDTLGMFNVVWNKMYKTEIIKENNLKFEKDGVPGEDILFNCEYFKYINSIKLIPKRLHHYMREDEDTLVSKYREDLYAQVQRFNKAKKDLYDYYDMNTEKYLKLYANTYIEYVSSAITNLYKRDCELNVQEKKCFIEEFIENEGIKAYMKYYIPHNFYEKLFKVMYSIKSPFIINLTYDVLFKIRHSFDPMYRKIRKQIISK